MARDSGSDVVIVGGGVIGCAIAYYLARMGVGVTIVEQGEIGCESTGASAGLLVPLTEAHCPGSFLDLALASLRMFPKLANSLAEESGIDIGYRPTGSLRLALNEDEESALRRTLGWQGLTGLALHWLSRTEVMDLEPQLTVRVRAAILTEGEHQVEPRRLIQGLGVAIRRMGVALRSRVTVRGFHIRDGWVRGVITSDGDVSCRYLVLAAGAWSGRLSKRLGVNLPVRPVRGQMISMSCHDTAINHLVFGVGGYLLPKADGTVWTGATMEDVGFRSRTTKEGVAWLRRISGTLVPALKSGPIVREWAGLRPGTPDGLPVMGSVPGWANVSLATGHFRSGVLLAPVTGMLMAEQVLQGRCGQLEPFSISRFGK